MIFHNLYDSEWIYFILTVLDEFFRPLFCVENNIDRRSVFEKELKTIVFNLVVFAVKNL